MEAKLQSVAPVIDRPVDLGASEVSRRQVGMMLPRLPIRTGTTTLDHGESKAVEQRRGAILPDHSICAGVPAKTIRQRYQNRVLSPADTAAEAAAGRERSRR